MIPRAQPRPSVTDVQDSVYVWWVSVATSVIGVTGAPRGYCPTVCPVGTASITGTGSLEISEVNIEHVLFF